METPCRNGRKQFPSVVWRSSVIFMSHAHAQVKASLALQILIGPSVMSPQLHTNRWHGCGLFCSSRTWCFHKWPFILLYLTSMALYITVPLPTLCPSPLNPTAKLRLTFIHSLLPFLLSTLPLASSHKYSLCPTTMVFPRILGL